MRHESYPPELELTSIMIVQDEIEFLVQSIPAVMQYSDQLVVLDLGSTDGSLDFIRSRLRKHDIILNIHWRNLYERGFSYVRNVARKAAFGKWIEYIDSDEMLLPDCRSELKDILSKTTAKVLSVTRFELEKKQEITTQWWPDMARQASSRSSYHRRICRNDNGIRWEGYIHEEIYEAERNAYFTAETVNLKYWHFSEFRTSYAPKFKHEKYAWMLLRAANRTELQFGTNPNWYEKHVPQHRDALELAANRFQNWLSMHGVNDLNWSE